MHFEYLSKIYVGCASYEAKVARNTARDDVYAQFSKIHEPFARVCADAHKAKITQEREIVMSC